MKNKTRVQKQKPSIRIRTNVKAGGFRLNHNQRLVGNTQSPTKITARPQTYTLKVKTSLKAGGDKTTFNFKRFNHNETLVSRSRRLSESADGSTRMGLRVRTNLKAGQTREHILLARQVD